MGLWFKLLALNVQVDFLIAETKNFPTLAERLKLHAQERGVEPHAGVLIDRGENEVI